MRVLWVSLSAIFAVAAVVFLIRQRFDAAFLSATLAGVAWFLNYRVQMKRIIAENEIPQRTDGNEDEEDLEP